MKTIILLIFAFSIHFSTCLYAQRPPKVHSIVKQLNTFEWYLYAARDWYEVLKLNPKDADAWLNFYTANRMARNMFPEEYSKTDEPYLQDLELIVEQASENIPGTFEFYYLKIYEERTFNDEFEMNLLKAYELGPNRPEVLDDLAAFYETRRDKERTNLFFKLWYESGDMSPGILNWNYNVLNSLDKKSIIITNGDNDTHPAIMLQKVLGVRSDVLVLNISLLMLDGYREKIFREFDLGNPEINYDQLRESQNISFDLQKLILRKIVEGAVKKKINIYFAFTLHPGLFEDLKDKIYMTGLAYKYSEREIDYLPVLVNNYKNNWLLDYLKISFTNDISEGIVKKFNVNYFPVFALIYKHFLSVNEVDEAYKLKQLALTIAEKSDAIEYYRSIFKTEK
ncbi:MAG: hypothetical protein AB9882_14250 [Ignavibacteriaceae bacterium]